MYNLISLGFLLKNIVYRFTIKNCIMRHHRDEKLSSYPSLSFLAFRAFSNLYSHEGMQSTYVY